MTAIDEVQAVLDLLSAGWLVANTDNKKPTFKRIIDIKVVPSNSHGYYAYVLGYELNNTVRSSGLGGRDEQIVTIALDIRTDGNAVTDGRQHALKIRDEVYRIIKTNYGKKLSSKYDRLQVTDGGKDLSDKMKGLYRHIVQVELRAYCI